MIHLYTPDNTNYEANGDIILLPTSCIVTAGINRTWQVDLEHPIDEEGRWKYIVADAVIKAPSFNGTQLWRIVQTEKRDSGIVATCDPIFYDAAHEVVVLERITLNNTTPAEAFNEIAKGSKYSIYSDITEQHSVWYQQENIVEIITGAEHGFAHTWEAEIGFNNYAVQVVDELGGDYGAAVLYGKNLAIDGIAESVNIDGTITRIIPVAYNGYTLPEMYVDSPLINNYPFPRIGIISYDNLRLWADRTEGEEGSAETEYFNSLTELYAAMRTKAQEEYSVNEVDKPTVGLEVDMVLIQNTEEYKDYKDLETVSIGDYVRCYNPRLGIDSTTRVRSLQYDCVLEAVTFVELGKEKRNYFDNVTSMMNATEKAIRPDGTVIAEQVQGFIDGAMAQLRLQNTIAKKQDVRAILFEDLDENSPTYGAMALGTQGFQISRERTADGRAWNWTTSATAAGIIANTIVAGLLTDKLGRNYWNLDTGAFSLQGATISNSDIDGYATDGELSAVNTQLSGDITNINNDITNINSDITDINGDITSLNTGLSNLETTLTDAISDLQDQIDGKVDTWFYSGVPALNKPPVTYDGSDPDTGWDTTEKKQNHVGDMYYDTDTGYAYRFQYENGVFSWVQIADSDVAEALEMARQAQAAANAAQTSADNAQSSANAAQTSANNAQSSANAAQATANTKVRVFTAQPTPPYALADLWFNGTEIKVCTTARSSGSFNASDWSRKDDYATAAMLTPIITRAEIAFNRATAKYGTCSTAAGTAAKVVTLQGTTLDLTTFYVGMSLTVLFTRTNTATSNVTLQIGNDASTKGAIRVKGAAFTGMYSWSANSLVNFVWDGTYWVMESNDQVETFNLLTKGGTMQGIYMQNGDLYINGTYIKAGTIEGITIQGNEIIGNTISGGTITGTEVNGGTVTGTTIKGSTFSIEDYNGKEVFVVTEGGYLYLFSFNGDDVKNAVQLDGRGIFVDNFENGGSVDITNGAITASNNSYGVTSLGWAAIQLQDTAGKNAYMDMRTSDFTIRAGKPVSFSAGTASSTTQRQFMRAVGNAVTMPGSLTVSGTKNRAVKTKDCGTRLLYAYETAEPYFGDIGEGEINLDGQVIIEIEPIFSETVNLENYQVFLQAYGEGSLYVAERKKEYFVVRGKPGLRFGYEVKAKQIDYSTCRLEQIEDIEE